MNKKDLVDRINILLELERKVIGIKVIRNEEEWEKISGKELKVPVSYCTAVKQAMDGSSLKMKNDMCSCVGSQRALGFKPAQPEYFSGESACALGLFDDKEISAEVSAATRMLDYGTYGVAVKPLELFESDPDAVMMVTDTYNAMRIMQGYTYTYGMQQGITATGNQAICVECTTNPLVRDDINISMLCSGTRFYAKWKASEVGIGMPFSKFEGVVKGVRNTANAVEMDARKVKIISGLRDLGDSTEDLIPGHTYYLQLQKEIQKNKQRCVK